VLGDDHELESDGVHLQPVGKSGHLKVFHDVSANDFAMFKWNKIQEVDADGNQVSPSTKSVNLAAAKFDWEFGDENEDEATATLISTFDVDDNPVVFSVEVVLAKQGHTIIKECTNDGILSQDDDEDDEDNVVCCVSTCAACNDDDEACDEDDDCCVTKILEADNSCTTGSPPCVNDGNFNLDQGDVKISIRVSGWTFAADDNQLSFGAELMSNSGDVSDTIDGEDGDNRRSVSFPNGRFVFETTAVADDTGVSIDATAVADGNHLDIEWLFPSFQESLFYDPTLSLTSGAASGTNAAAIVVPLLVVLLIGGVGFWYYKKKKKSTLSTNLRDTQASELDTTSGDYDKI